MKTFLIAGILAGLVADQFIASRPPTLGSDEQIKQAEQQRRANPEQAIAEAQAEITSRPRATLPYVDLARAHLYRRDVSSAVAATERMVAAVAGDPLRLDRVVGLNFAAAAYYAEGHFAEAARFSEWALSESLDTAGFAAARRIAQAELKAAHCARDRRASPRDCRDQAWKP